ncbi:hypothetical protein PspLS_11701, partial [Pyricularia sp. CBS 133598]
QAAANPLYHSRYNAKRTRTSAFQIRKKRFTATRLVRLSFQAQKNAGLRKKKSVESLIKKNHLSVAGISTKRLSFILRSLQEGRVFESTSFGQAAFLQLRSSEPAGAAPSAAPASVPTQIQAMIIYLTGDSLDITIASATRNYPVHRAIEDFESVITLHDNEPLVVDMMLQYFYLLDYNAPGLLLHAKVYAITDNYTIAGLKALAVVKFKSSVGEAWNTEDFLDAAIETYSSTIDTDRDMRNAVIETFARRKELLEPDEVKKLVRKLDQLAYDLLLHFHNEGRIL